MGSLKEWSLIFDVADNAEFFCAKLYERGKTNDGVVRKTGDEADEYIKAAKDVYRKKNDDEYERYEPQEVFWENIEWKLSERFFESEKMMRETEKRDDFYAMYENEVKFGENLVYALKERQEETEKFGVDDMKMFETYEEGQKGEWVIAPKTDFFTAEIGKIGGGQREKILNAMVKKYAEALGNVRIEVTNNNTIEKESDIDEISDRLTEKLCEMMSRGADGLY